MQICNVWKRKFHVSYLLPKIKRVEVELKISIYFIKIDSCSWNENWIPSVSIFNILCTKLREHNSIMLQKRICVRIKSFSRNLMNSMKECENEVNGLRFSKRARMNWRSSRIFFMISSSANDVYEFIPSIFWACLCLLALIRTNFYGGVVYVG